MFKWMKQIIIGIVVALVFSVGFANAENEVRIPIPDRQADMLMQAGTVTVENDWYLMMIKYWDEGEYGQYFAVYYYDENNLMHGPVMASFIPKGAELAKLIQVYDGRGKIIAQFDTKEEVEEFGEKDNNYIARVVVNYIKTESTGV